jgi:hypothetical protein
LAWVNAGGELALGTGDDHWMAHSFMTAAGDYLTMMFNGDGHPIDDDAIERPGMGGISAWAVTNEVPEAMTLILLGLGLVGLAGLSRRL